jgi:hypothetical protein
MAKDMVCKLCESSPEPEVGVMLVSDLTGSGQLPFAVGLNCMTDFLTGLLETFAQPEGITPPEPSELDEEEAEEAARDAVAAQELSEEEYEARLAMIPVEDPTGLLEPSGPSPVESSAPDTGNGSGKRPARPKASTKTNS